MKMIFTTDASGAKRVEKRISRVGRAFTLLELLVVIAIIGILAAIGLPAIKGMSKSNSMVSANRQLLDDLAYARQRAIAEHTTVYVVFIPPPINVAPSWNTIYQIGAFPKYSKSELTVVSNLWAGQYTTYVLMTLRTVGDQPGNATPRYLTSWRTLPNGVFIATNKFSVYNPAIQSEYSRAFPDLTSFIPYPLIVSPTSTQVRLNGLPYIAFNHLGQLTTGQNEAIPLAHGSIMFLRDSGGGVAPGPADVLETPPNNSTVSSNVIHIDWLTGKARVERQEVQ